MMILCNNGNFLFYMFDDRWLYIFLLLFDYHDENSNFIRISIIRNRDNFFFSPIISTHKIAIIRYYSHNFDARHAIYLLCTDNRQWKAIHTLIFIIRIEMFVSPGIKSVTVCGLVAFLNIKLTWKWNIVPPWNYIYI